MKIYSPSQLTMHQFCGTARQLSQQGWKPKYLTALNIAQWVGIAVAKGLEDYHTNHDKPAAWTAAAREYEACLDHALAGGQIMGQQADTSHLDALERIKKFMHLAIDNEPLQNWKLLHSEYTFHNGARPDLIAYDPEGRLSIVDYKCMKEFPKRKSYTKYFESHFIGNQAMTYKYLYEEEFKQPVERFYICLLTLDPEEVQVKGISYDPRRYKLWLDSAEVSWRRMEVEDELDTPSTENATHTNDYGQCDYFNACVYMARDPTMMQDAYVQIERRDR